MYQFFLECNVIIIIIFNFYEETYIKKCRNKIIFERVWKKLYSLYIKILLDIVGTLFNFDIILIQKISTNIEKYANKLITQLSNFCETIKIRSIALTIILAIQNEQKNN